MLPVFLNRRIFNSTVSVTMHEVRLAVSSIDLFEVVSVAPYKRNGSMCKL